MHWKAGLLSLALPACAAVHESIAAVPAGWSQLEVSDESTIHLQVAVTLQNLDQLESKLLSVSSPDSADYGKYLEKEDVDSLFGPADDDVNKVKSWIATANADNVEYNAGVVSFTTTIANANKLLSTKFGLYSNGQTSKVRTTAYSVPDELTDSIDFVSPTVMFGSTKAFRAIPEPVAAPEPELVERQFKHDCTKKVEFQNQTFHLIGPQCLMAEYGTTGYEADANSGSTIAFGSFLNQSASMSDAAKYLKIWGLPANNFKINALINGGVNNQSAPEADLGEANLDSQNILGLVGPLPVGEYITGGSPPFVPDLLTPNATENQNEPYLQYYTYLLSQKNADLPYVITNSYGDEENTVPPKYAARVCNLIGMMSMRGRTILESSGDLGTGAVCRTNQGPKKAQFTPIFPATCPYLTAVGGLQFFLPVEHAWNGSSGGFSNYFGRPSWQNGAVEAYLNTYISKTAYAYYKENDYANFSGRGFPDVSAHSLYPEYMTVIQGQPQPNGGTSAASPVFAAIVALLNDALLRAGKPALGFLNPWLYSKGAAALTDITRGGSLGCDGTNLQSGLKVPGSPGIIPYASWNATIGWDPVTGLGAPDFVKMKALALGGSGGWGWNSTSS